MKQFIIFLVIIICCGKISAATISGKITDINGQPISFATIAVKNSPISTTADFNGKYFINIKYGTYTLIYSYLGKKSVEKKVTIQKNEHVIMNIVLEKADIEITEIEVVANKIDKAKIIMKKVRQKRKIFLSAVKSYKCESYVKTTLERQYQKIDSSIITNNGFKTYLERENLNLIETVAEIYHKKPNYYKEIIRGYHNFVEEKAKSNVSISFGGNISYGEYSITPTQLRTQNPYVFYENTNTTNFNFYKNLIKIPKLSAQPIVSPIAGNANLYYNFKFNGSFFKDSVKINRIDVEPKNSVSALFYGTIYIQDSSWALVELDLNINKKALLIYKDFNIKQSYKKFGNEIFLPTESKISYTINDGKDKIIGNTKISCTNYQVNQNLDKKILNNQVIEYEVDALEKDSVFWENNRTATLRNDEIKFIHKTDSIKDYFLSNEYLDKQDSLYRKLRWYSPAIGIGYKNHYIGLQVWIGGILEQINPFGIGGYRHKLPINGYKEFNNGMKLETKFFIDYGFKNKDFKGKFGVGLTYFPLKFVRTFITIGDYYDKINNYASFEQVFSRSNYVRTKSVSIKQRMEIFNGFYSELELLYSNQIPINNLKLAKWSDFLFDTLNKPNDFKQYVKTELLLHITYKIGQKYIIKNNRKIIINNDLPTILFLYRKGIPKFFNSEVDFDYLQIASKGIFDLARLGESRWQIKLGIFLNRKNLRTLEYAFFRGSDYLIFSNPVSSFQLLGPTMSANAQFLQANFIHHFNGSILNKIPLFKYLKMSIATGTGALIIPEHNFLHAEMFLGLEKIFRIKTDLFRIGLYAVTADNSIDKANIRLKIGLSFFEDYKKRWSY